MTATAFHPVYDDEHADHNRRARKPGRRADDVQRHWPLYFAVLMQIATIVYGAGIFKTKMDDLEASNVRTTAQQEHFLALAIELEKSVATLNCQVGLTCNNTRH